VKKRIIILGMTLLLCCMGGCLQEVPLTDAEMDAVAEYAAGLLLKHDLNYNSPLLPEKIMEELLNPSPTPVPTEIPDDISNGNSDGKVTPTPVPEVTEETNAQLTEIIGLDGFEVKYVGYVDNGSAIENNSYYSLEAKKGYKYITLNFTIRNLTQEEKVFDASGQKLTYMLDVDVKNRYRAVLSMLKNDMQYMDITIPAEGTETAVLVFEIKDTESEQLHLILSDSEDHSVFIKVK